MLTPGHTGALWCAATWVAEAMSGFGGRELFDKFLGRHNLNCRQGGIDPLHKLQHADGAKHTVFGNNLIIK